MILENKGSSGADLVQIDIQRFCLYPKLPASAADAYLIGIEGASTPPPLPADSASTWAGVYADRLSPTALSIDRQVRVRVAGFALDGDSHRQGSANLSRGATGYLTGGVSRGPEQGETSNRVEWDLLRIQIPTQPNFSGLTNINEYYPPLFFGTVG